MKVLRSSTNQVISLDTGNDVGRGGEARILAVSNDHTIVAKIYHKGSADHMEKLKVMIANPPNDSAAKSGNAVIAWPRDLLLDANTRRFVGFIMPRVTGRHSVIHYYSPAKRKLHCPLFDYRYLHRTARNLAAAVQLVHDCGYVIGDVNESNIMVGSNALVTLVDTDSFQVRQKRGGLLGIKIFHCGVGKPEYTPPELQKKSFAGVERLEEHDRFGLGVLIFQLLMEGVHPFAGLGDPAVTGERIQRGLFPHARQARCSPPPSAPPFSILHPTVQQLFRLCFEEGNRTPAKRPSAAQWRDALTEVEKKL